MSNGTTPEGRDWKISAGTGETYPTADHKWGEFAGLAIEMGGYNDLSAVDPYTGRRFWLEGAMRCDAHSAALHAATPGDEAMAVYAQVRSCEACNAPTPLIAGIRRLLDAMEAAQFLDCVAEPPVSRT